MKRIKLNFINKSNDANNSDIVLFQKNTAQGQDDLCVAWKVIQNCGKGDNHPFTFPQQLTVNATDSYGNQTAELNAKQGNAFSMRKTVTGDELIPYGKAKVATEFEVTNNLPMGSITINCYRNGKLMGTSLNLVPQQLAAFQFRPVIFIGVVQNIAEGEIMNAAVLSEIYTEISLIGIASADIVMTGGGVGPQATPFYFTLENITFA
jgi:hypothetical protein